MKKRFAKEAISPSGVKPLKLQDTNAMFVVALLNSVEHLVDTIGDVLAEFINITPNAGKVCMNFGEFFVHFPAETSQFSMYLLAQTANAIVHLVTEATNFGFNFFFNNGPDDFGG